MYIVNNYLLISVLFQKNGNGYEIVNIMYINLVYIEVIIYFKFKNFIIFRIIVVKFVKIYLILDFIIF